MTVQRVAASALALTAGALTLGAAVPAAAADPATAGFSRVRIGTVGKLIAEKECFKDLAIQHQSSKKFLEVHATGPSATRNTVRATGAKAAKGELFELCILGPGSDEETAQVYLRSQKVRQFVQVDKVAGRRDGALRGRASTLAASTDFDAVVVAETEAVFRFRSTYNDKWVTVERNYPGTDDELVRAGRPAAATGENFVLWAFGG
ncbi:hypothetical protein GCM10010123_22120 [Pilimelia anulata]|uniref:Uncharacterized protein n=1 Tax=Pilimelia anulata TaxID=53371 RepID=A0A8J3B320_9ACTN|nr:hypothetical protein [Pilimelia anulata]GGJ91888.1 hypothetical protein GCM10010123_22120 [Pilimelia anulata]